MKTEVTELRGTLETMQQRLLRRLASSARSRRLRWRGGETQVIEAGSGFPVLLIHGGFGEAFDWAPILEPLARRYHVFAVDRPGNGLADPYDYRGADILTLASEFVGDVLDGLGLTNAAIVANSMGGLWTAAFALHAQERVTRIAFVGSPAGVKRRVPVQLCMMRWPLTGSFVRRAWRKPTREGIRSFLKQIVVAHPERLDNDLLDAFVESLRRNCESWISFSERILDAWGLRRELVIGDRWTGLRMPVLFLWGDKDAFGPPSEGEAIAARLPTARLVRIPSAGHLPWLDEPQRCAELLVDFLK